MGYYASICPTCGGPATFWSITTPGYTTCRCCDERIKFLQVMQAKARKPCSFDPKTIGSDVPIGMFHCPECGEMVIAGMDHPNYSLLMEIK